MMPVATVVFPTPLVTPPMTTAFNVCLSLQFYSLLGLHTLAKVMLDIGDLDHRVGKINQRLWGIPARDYDVQS